MSHVRWQRGDAQRSLVDLFSAVLDGEIGNLSGESLFDFSELKVISEFHTDVFSTPVEQLVLAFDYVKSNVLRGKPYERDDHTKVALELKKFLTSSGDKKQKAFQAEAIRQTNVAVAERAKRERAEQDAKERQAEVALLEAKVQEAGRRHVADARRECFLRAGLAVLGALLTAGVWAFDSQLVITILRVLSLESSFDILVRPIVRIVGAAVLVGSCFPAIRPLKPTYRMGALTVIIAIAAGGSDLVGLALVTRISGYLAIAAPIALAFTIILEWSRIVHQDET